MRTRLVAAALAAALSLSACSDAADTELSAVEVAAETGAEAPPRDAHLVDAGWPEVAAWIAREADDGRPTVVNLWASWCGPCRAEAPILRAAIDAHPEVAFLGVDHQDRREDGEAFLAEERLEFPTVFDLPGDVSRAIDARGMPTTAFFDHTGRLVAVHTGVLTEQLLAQRLADLEAAAAAARG
jgi:thiol-disulfide isomerase/thioredoxin